MNYIRTLMVTAALFSVSACATDYTAQQRKEKMAQATLSLQNGAYFEAFEAAKPYIGNSLSDRSDFLTLFKKSAGFPDGLRSGLKNLIATMHTEIDLATIEGDFATIETAALLPPNDLGEMRTLLVSSLNTSVAAGTFQTAFGRVTQQYPTVLDGEGLSRVMDKTVDELIASGARTNVGRRKPVITLFEVARNNPAAAAYRPKLESSLMHMHFTMDELREDVATLFPVYASSEITNRTKVVLLTTNPARRLLEVDVAQRMTKDPEIELATSSKKPRFTVEIDELEYREQEGNSTTRTVTVGYYEADIMYAVLFLPKNASFLFDVVEKSQQVQWGYEIKVTGPKGTRSKILRDDQNDTSHQCVNPRVVNVFGGVSSPSGWPNSQTANFCSTGTNTRSLRDVRDTVLDRVSDTVKDLMADVL